MTCFLICKSCLAMTFLIPYTLASISPSFDSSARILLCINSRELIWSFVSSYSFTFELFFYFFSPFPFFLPDVPLKLRGLGEPSLFYPTIAPLIYWDKESRTLLYKKEPKPTGSLNCFWGMEGDLGVILKLSCSMKLF